MDFITAVKTCFAKYATFTGRARRSEFWYFYLFGVIISVICNVLGPIGTWLSLILGLVMFLPQLAVAVRRLHDTGRSGYWMLLPMIPYGLAIALLAPVMETMLVSPENMSRIETVVNDNMSQVMLGGLMSLLVLAGAIVLLVFFVKDSDMEANKYGENPKGF